MSTRSIDNMLETAAGSGNISGVVALAADRSGVIYEGAAGRRSVSAEAPMTPDTVMFIASMTKAITSVAALQQIEAGRLKLDGPISEVLPEHANPTVLIGYGADGKPRLRTANSPITLRHLLTHTAGFAYDIWDADLLRYMQEHGVPEAVSRQNAPRTPLRSDPGARWLYGTSIDVVGHAVEAVTGQTLGGYISERITGPLQMIDTGFHLAPAMRSRLSPIHRRGSNGRLVPTGLEFPTTPEVEEGGGGLYSTMHDYLRFLRMLLGRGTLDGVRVLSDEMTAVAMRNQSAPIEITRLTTAMPEYSADVDLFPGTPKGWGLVGMVNDKETGTGRSAGSIAWAGLANTFWWIDAERSQAAVIGTQLLPFADPFVVDLVDSYERALHNLSGD